MDQDFGRGGEIKVSRVKKTVNINLKVKPSTSLSFNCVVFVSATIWNKKCRREKT